MPEQPVQEKPRRAPHPFALAILLMVLTFGIVFAAMLAHQLMIRQHRLIMQAHQATEMRLRSPDAQQCPALSGRVPYHHAHRDRLTVGYPAAPGCLPASGRWT